MEDVLEALILRYVEGEEFKKDVGEKLRQCSDFGVTTRFAEMGISSDCPGQVDTQSEEGTLRRAVRCNASIAPLAV